MEDYEYATAKSEIESFFWQELADNYLEMCKQRLYDEAHPLREGARFALYQTLLTLVKLFAPFLPHITEEIYLGMFAIDPECVSIHTSVWPLANPALESDDSEALGRVLVEIATAVRRYKSEHNLPLGTEISQLQLVTSGEGLAADKLNPLFLLDTVEADLKSITRARVIEVVTQPDPSMTNIFSTPQLQVTIGES
jgi:valyl-tRNA synthetase